MLVRHNCLAEGRTALGLKSAVFAPELQQAQLMWLNCEGVKRKKECWNASVSQGCDSTSGERGKKSGERGMNVRVVLRCVQFS